MQVGNRRSLYYKKTWNFLSFVDWNFLQNQSFGWRQWGFLCFPFQYFFLRKTYTLCCDRISADVICYFPPSENFSSYIFLEILRIICHNSKIIMTFFIVSFYRFLLSFPFITFTKSATISKTTIYSKTYRLSLLFSTPLNGKLVYEKGILKSGL